MAIITSIKPQKNQKRVNIYLDNKFGFGLDLENFVKLQLKVDQDLSDDQIIEVIKKGEFQKSLDKLLRFATLRPRSEKEVRDYLKRKKVHESSFEELFNKLKRLELIDDEKFAKWWVEQRQTFKPKPKRVLLQELRIKGIGIEIIKEVLGETEINEEKLARELIEKKMYKWEKLDKYNRKQKITQFLGSKGFDWNVINDVLNYLTGENI